MFQRDNTAGRLKTELSQTELHWVVGKGRKHEPVNQFVLWLFKVSAAVLKIKTHKEKLACLFSADCNDVDLCVVLDELAWVHMFAVCFSTCLKQFAC